MTTRTVDTRTVGADAMFDYKCKITRVVDGDTVDIDLDLVSRASELMWQADYNYDADSFQSVLFFWIPAHHNPPFISSGLKHCTDSDALQQLR